MVRAQLFIAQAKRFHSAGAKVFDDDIRPHREFAEYVAPGGLLEVERDAALVAVHGEERGGLAVEKGRSHAARIVTAVGLFDFDDIRAHVAEQERAKGARHNLTNIE